MASFDPQRRVIAGPGGSLQVRPEDEVARKFLMLLEGECGDAGPLKAAAKFGYSKQRYFQIRAAYAQWGTSALQSQKRGPKTNYRRTSEIVQQVIRHRFLDADASAEVIAQKLRQTGWTISVRSVARVIAEYGLQNKTPQMPARGRGRKDKGPDHQHRRSGGRRRSAQH